MTASKCPCCGGSLRGPAPIASLPTAALSPYERRLVEILIGAHPRPLTKEYLVERLYEDDPNGGPDNAPVTLRHFIWQLRRKLPAHGWTVPKNTGGSGYCGTYRLSPVVNA